MDEVRQAHLIGNFELYDPDSGEPGAALCKSCWEEAGTRNSSSLETVWVKTEGRESMLWLCRGHVEGMKSDVVKSNTLVRSASGVIRYPALQSLRERG